MQVIDISVIDAFNFLVWLVASFGLSKIFKKFSNGILNPLEKFPFIQFSPH